MRRLLPDLFHLADRAAWERATRVGSYDRSTRAASLAEVGYLHACFFWQVDGVAARFYADCADPLVLLRIDPDAVGADIRVEPDDEGGHFPHIYGPLPVAAVVEVMDFDLGVPLKLPPEPTA